MFSFYSHPLCHIGTLQMWDHYYTTQLPWPERTKVLLTYFWVKRTFFYIGLKMALIWTWKRWVQRKRFFDPRQHSAWIHYQSMFYEINRTLNSHSFSLSVNKSQHWNSLTVHCNKKTLAHKPQGLRFCVIYFVVICFSCQNKLMTFVLTISLFLFGGHLYVLKCISQQRTVNKTRIHRSQHVQRRHRLVQHSPFPFPQNVVRLTNVLHFCRKIKLIRMGMQMLKVLKKPRCKGPFTPRVSVNAARTQQWCLRFCSHWKQWSRSRMGLQPIFKWFHWFQWEQNRKHHRRVVAALTLTLGLNGP